MRTGSPARSLIVIDPVHDRGVRFAGHLQVIVGKPASIGVEIVDDRIVDHRLPADNC